MFFITGADCLLNIEEWKEVEKIFSLATLVVFSRESMSQTEIVNRKKIIEDKFNKKIIYLELNKLEISSTEIRERVSQNKRIDFFVPKKVMDIISENSLYTK